MKHLRRMGLGIGAGLLVLGLGMMQAARDQRTYLPEGTSRQLWIGKENWTSLYFRPKPLLVTAVPIMALGAGLIGFSVLPASTDREGLKR